MDIKNKLGAVAVALGLMHVACSAADQAPWREQMQCGDTQYVIESDCKPSNDPTALSQCKAQTLSVSHGGTVRKAKLPELNKVSAKSIVETGGKVSKLFVTQWACARGDKGDVAVMYYSIGGGSAPYAEAYSIYDEAGVLIENEDSAKYEQALAHSDGHMKKVKSIMPR
ncbi:hypothetical protein GTP81_09315 [Rugamonas sp. FT107W]|uniref:DUF4189 domain-containing protein n=1 Tax=Duganella vulcania TaxID=2692166 RepID=A0A845HDV6_9BURK|nr:hypothetical protein [Duganella vulcania]MYN16951.1 hypothetical protein [Duganella vulcania]